MRKLSWAWAVVVAVACGQVVQSYAADAKQIAGEWTGTWEGGGAAGKLDLTFEANGAHLGGGVTVGQDGGDYTAKFASATLDGNKLIAKYEYTPDPQAEIVLTGSIEGNKVSGAWVMQPKGQEMQLASGTWSASKK